MKLSAISDRGRLAISLKRPRLMGCVVTQRGMRTDTDNCSRCYMYPGSRKLAQANAVIASYEYSVHATLTYRKDLTMDMFILIPQLTPVQLDLIRYRNQNIPQASSNPASGTAATRSPVAFPR